MDNLAATSLSISAMMTDSSPRGVSKTGEMCFFGVEAGANQNCG